MRLAWANMRPTLALDAFEEVALGTQLLRMVFVWRRTCWEQDMKIHIY
jgi:hypothetical protein